MLKQPAENRNVRLGGGYFEDFGDNILARNQNQLNPPQPNENDRNEERNDNPTDELPEENENNNPNVEIMDTNSNISSTYDREPPTMKEPGSYPAIPVPEYREGPIEEIAVHYVRINKIVEKKQPRNKIQEDNVRTAELDFMLDLETLIKEIEI